MPWKECTPMTERIEFVHLAVLTDANIAELSKRFGISRKTAYKWLGRYQQQGLTGLMDLSRQPHHSPQLAPPDITAAVLKLRRRHPRWGGRKLRRRLLLLGHTGVPAPSTITAILRRHGSLSEAASSHRPYQRFEAKRPNDLWQMDFKGHFAIAQGRCHPLTVLDDHSRYAVGLHACPDERGERVKAHLVDIFRRHGLPRSMLMDNGGPWGHDQDHPYTPLTVWLLRLGIRVIHGRPYHPQTQGKDERFHRTLKAEVLGYCQHETLAGCQQHFTRWRQVYNWERPHDALALSVPGDRFRVSERPYPECLAPIEYGPDDKVRKVCQLGMISFCGHTFKVGKAFSGEYVAIRPQVEDGNFDVVYCNQQVAELSFKV